MDSSIDSLSDAESNSSWILVNDSMCDDNKDVTKTISNLKEEEERAADLLLLLGTAGSGHESDTSDGISIISDFDSDQERTVLQNEPVLVSEEEKEQKEEEEEEKEEEEEGGGGGGEEENRTDYGCELHQNEDDSSLVQSVSSQIAEDLRGSKHLKIPHFLTISIFGAVFAVSSVFILQLLNSSDVQDVGGNNEYSHNSHKEIALSKDTSNKIEKENFHILQYCAVKHRNDDLFQEYNERKCAKAFSKETKTKKTYTNLDMDLQKQTAFKSEIDFKVQDSNAVEGKVKISKSKYKGKKSKKASVSRNDENSSSKINEKIRFQPNKNEYLTKKFMEAKQDFLNAKENYLKNKERYIRNMAVTIKEKSKLKKETRQSNTIKFQSNTNRTQSIADKRKQKIKKTEKRKIKNKKGDNKVTESIEKEENLNLKYKKFVPKLYKNKRNNSISGDWYHKLYNERSQIRQKEGVSDWFFDRSKMRNRKRDKAQWYFQWMTDREQLRYKRGYRFVSN